MPSVILLAENVPPDLMEFFEPADVDSRSSVLRVSSTGYPGAHFATFPPELVRPCIRAGTSEKGACASCGAPWRRVVTTERVPTRPGSQTKVEDEEGSRLDGMVTGNRDPLRHCTESRTVGWCPGCACYGLELIEDVPTKRGKETEAEYTGRLTEWKDRWSALGPRYEAVAGRTVPCVVCDPFIGSGTTAQVCIEEKRRCWGIDLSEVYLVENAIPRITGALGARPALAHLIPRKEVVAPRIASMGMGRPGRNGEGSK